MNNFLITAFANKPIRYLLLVAFPCFCVWFYLQFIASSGYVGRAQFMVEEDAPQAMAGAELALGLLSVSGGRSKQDALLIDRFMQSRTMLEWLDAKLDLKGHFSDKEIDWFGRLDTDVSAEEFLDYFRSQLVLTIDEDALIIGVDFISYDADYSQRVVQALVDRSELFVNEISRGLAQQQLSFVEEQVATTYARLSKASDDMIRLQKKNDILSPTHESEVIGQILAALEGELVSQKTQLITLMAYLHSDSADVVAAKHRINAIEQQIESERNRLIGRGSQGMNELLLEYKQAEVNASLAGEIYKSALASLEATRLDATRKIKYVVLVDAPSRPDSAEQPRVAYWTVTIFIMLNLLYFVASLIAATIQDHRE
ncbi:MAG: hypothetical protein ACSHXK_01225 [Oceanococcus sp.]